MKWPTSFDAAPNNLSIDSTLCAQLHLLLWAACLSSASARNKKQNKKGGAVNSLPEEKRKNLERKFFPFSTSLTYRSKLLHLYSDCVCHDDYDYYFDFLFPSLRVTHWQSSVNWSCHICWPKLFAVNWKTNEPKRDWRPS